MTDLIFKISPNIMLGPYAVSRIAQQVKDFGSRFMVVMDPILKEVNLAENILQPLAERNVEYFVFDELNDGANTESINQILSLARESHIHGIIAIGGTKALHSAAVAAALVNEKSSIYDCIDGAVPVAPPLPLICVPTTIRAPYAFTSALPVVDSRSHQIKLAKIQNGVCKLFLWDSNLSLTLTDNQRTSIALETLCIALEAYLSQKANFFSDMFVEKSIELMGYGLDGAKSLEITTPSELLQAQAGCMASLASSLSSVGAAGLLALAINARFKISRSLVTSILLPYIIEEVGKFKTDKIEKLAHILNAVPQDIHKEQAVQAFAENIRQRLAKANLPVRLKELSISIEQLALAAEDAGQLDFVNSLPRSMTSDDLFDLLKQAY
ncbi:MAG: iron-containing alcohol dehydrogenase [Treponema sp.]